MDRSTFSHSVASGAARPRSGFHPSCGLRLFSWSAGGRSLRTRVIEAIRPRCPSRVHRSTRHPGRPPQRRRPSALLDVRRCFVSSSGLSGAGYLRASPGARRGAGPSTSICNDVNRPRSTSVKREMQRRCSDGAECVYDGACHAAPVLDLSLRAHGLGGTVLIRRGPSPRERDPALSGGRSACAAARQEQLISAQSCSAASATKPTLIIPAGLVVAQFERHARYKRIVPVHSRVQKLKC